MSYYCTLFDSFYLSRGLVMINSLQKHASNFHLYVFAFDNIAYDILIDLKLENITVISIRDFETPELLAVKEERSKAEYYWTSTPAVIKYVFSKYRVTNCTYVDADLMFYDDPSVLLSELKSNTTVLITEHRYSFLERIYEEKRAGKFCVQFITFNDLQESQLILDTWANQCLEWCYNKYEDGKFGDQKYLDEWPFIYNNVHILENEGGGVAPWNIKNYIFTGHKNEIIIIRRKTRKSYKLIFFHFQNLKIKHNYVFDLGWHYINKKIRNLIYKDYISRISNVEKMLTSKNKNYSTSYFYPVNNSIKDLIKNSFKGFTGYNTYKL